MGAQQGTARATGEATLDSSGRLRELVLDALVADSDAAAPTRAHWEVMFSVYGRPVELEIPDADDVVDLADIPELNETFFRGQ